MNGESFGKILERRLRLIQGTLGMKAAEYAPGDERLHNFKRAAAILGQTPAQACVGMMLKHWVSVLDLVEAEALRIFKPVELIDEKIGDAINYLILLEAILKEPL